MATETITLRLVAQDLMSGNVSKAIGKIDTLAKRGGLMGSVMQGVGQSFGQMLNPLGMVTNAIGGLTGYLQDGFTAATQETAAIEKMSVAIRENDKAWAGNIDQLEGVISARQRAFAFADSDQREAIARLVAVTKDYNKALELERQAMDLARLKSMSLVDASELLAKVYSGNLGILSRYGIVLKKGTTAAQALAEIQKRAAGQAEAYGKSSAGAAERLSLALSDLQENVGHFLEGPGTDFVEWLNDLVATINGGDFDSEFRKLGQHLVDIRNGVEDTSAAADAGGDPIKSYLDGLQAFNDVLNPAADEARDLRRELDDLRITAGVSEQAFVDMFFALKDDAQLGAAGARAEIQRLLTSMILARETSTAITPLLSQGWADSMGTIEHSTESAALTVKQAMAGMRRAVRQTIDGTLTTMADMKDPWKTAWKEYAEYAKDPFKPKQFANYIERYAKRAERKAREAAENGEKPAARAWGRLARAARNPVVVALTQIGVEVDDAIAAITLVKNAANQLLNTVIPSITSPFGNDNDGTGHATPVPRKRKGKKNRAGGGHVMGGESYIVGEDGPEMLHIGAGTGGYVTPGHQMGGGGTVVINMNGLVVAPSEAELDRIARVLAPGLRRVGARAGA